MNAAAITATIGGDVAPLRAAGDDAVGTAGQIADRMAKKFESRDIGRTLATSLGLNLESISQNVARFITGVSKADEENYKQLGDLSDQLATKETAYARSKLTDAQQYTLLMQDQARIQASIDANVFSSLDKQVQKKSDQQALDNSIQVSDALSAKMEHAAAVQSEADFAQKQKLLDGLAAAWAKYDADVLQRQKQIASEVDKSITLQDKITEQKNAQLPIEDQLVAAQKEKSELLATQKTTVKGSNDYLELQIQINDKINDITTLGLQIAQKTADAIEQQATAAKEVATQQQASANFAGNFSSTGRDNSELSDQELQNKIAAVQKSVFAGEVNDRGGYGGVGSGGLGVYDPILQIENQNLQGALAELKRRDDVRQTAGTLGDTVAQQKYGLTDSQLAQILGTVTDNSKIVDQLTQLNQSLKNGTARVSNIPLSS